jgi:hypothetical protein
LLITAFSLAANPNRALNPQEIRTFSQVFAARHHLVASL